MTNNKLGEVRRSAALMNYGPGAIIDFRVPGSGAPVSVIAAGLEEWDERSSVPGLQNPQTIYEPRLQKKLGAQGFRPPPVKPDEDTSRSDLLLGVRFPKWLQCPKCEFISLAGQWAQDPGDAARYCASCSDKLPGRLKAYVVPVRFITACAKGHIDDFPWHFWVRHKTGCENTGLDARLRLRATGAGLAGLRVVCPKCKKSRSLEDIFKGKALAGYPCFGKRPWLRSDEETCGLERQTLQRGASNLYFAKILSAIDIPPWSDNIQKALGIYWDPILSIEARDQRRIFLTSIWNTLGLTDMDLEQLVDSVEARIVAINEPERSNLRWDEFQQLCAQNPGNGHKDLEFDIRHEDVPNNLSSFISRLVRVVRLREVRAITGFTRIDSEGGTTSAGTPIEVAPLSQNRLNWLPAIEVRGEGIFIELDQNAISNWLKNSNAAVRSASIANELSNSRSMDDNDKESPSPELAARFLLVHSLAHVLMRQLSLQCGYSSASLRERLYIGDTPIEFCGLLIYTASPDADGTLGGLQRQGESARFGPILTQAINGIKWCSSDPLCIEGVTSASQPTNLAACHSCVLASETSCEEFNQYLDRAMLVGTPDQPELGFFSNIPADSSEITNTSDAGIEREE